MSLLNTKKFLKLTGMVKEAGFDVEKLLAAKDGHNPIKEAIVLAEKRGLRAGKLESRQVTQAPAPAAPVASGGPVAGPTAADRLEDLRRQLSVEKDPVKYKEIYNRIQQEKARQAACP